MAGATTVSAKISSDMRKKLDEFHVPVSKVIREALEAEIRKREEEIVAHGLDRARDVLNKVPKGRIVEIIRSDRDAVGEPDEGGR